MKTNLEIAEENLWLKNTLTAHENYISQSNVFDVEMCIKWIKILIKRCQAHLKKVIREKWIAQKSHCDDCEVYFYCKTCKSYFDDFNKTIKLYDGAGIK